MSVEGVPYCAGCGKAISPMSAIAGISNLKYHLHCKPEPKHEQEELADIIPLPRKEKRFTAVAICLTCQHRWPGQITRRTAIFKIRCPKCAESESFVSFLPDDYLMEHV